jgi:hypothetical protein
MYPSHDICIYNIIQRTQNKETLKSATRTWNERELKTHYDTCCYDFQIIVNSNSTFK